MLELLSFVKEHLAWYLVNKLISDKAATLIDDQFSKLVKEISNFTDEIVNGFNIPKGCLKAPIYDGYQQYYSVKKTGGEHYNRKPKF